MSAKPVWGWQPRRSLGSCGVKGESQVRDGVCAGRWGSNSQLLAGWNAPPAWAEDGLGSSYLVEESLEDAGGLDRQRAGDSDLLFQYNCGRGQKQGQRWVGWENDTDTWAQHVLLHTPMVIQPSVLQLHGHTGMVSKQVWHAFIGVYVCVF